MKTSRQGTAAALGLILAAAVLLIAAVLLPEIVHRKMVRAKINAWLEAGR